MSVRTRRQLKSGIFITFSGNCKKALSHYHACFGGTLDLEMFPTPLPGFQEQPVISGSLISERIVIHGSDLVCNEGRKIGNYLSVFLPCYSLSERSMFMDYLLQKPVEDRNFHLSDQKLIELTDDFDVHWILSI